MAAEGKKSVSINKILSPFLEVKGKKAPPWFDAIPNCAKDIPPLLISRKMELDMRKWKVSDIENGIQAVARYELKVFAMAVSKAEKAVMAAIPKEKLKNANWAKLGKEFYANRKSPERDALEKAKTSIAASWKSVAQEIENKVSLALDEVEADTGDNKKAIASTKEAIKKFKSVEKGKIIEGPINDLSKAIDKFVEAFKFKPAEDAEGDQLKNDQKKYDAALKEVDKLVSGAEGSFNTSAKKVNEVVKYFIDTGRNLSKDTKANVEFQNFGKEVLKHEKSLTELESVIDALERLIADVKNLIKKGDPEQSRVEDLVKKVNSIDSMRGDKLGTARASVGKIEKLFIQTEKKVKA